MCCCSGDKLLGGPQSGIILGRQSELTTISRHPLVRALRVDKLTYAALEATLLEHLAGRAPDTVPVMRMLHVDVEQLRARAQAIAETVGTSSAVEVVVTEGAATIGGGAAPGTTVASALIDVALDGLTPSALKARLRAATPPVVGRIDNDRLLLDLRTVAPTSGRDARGRARGAGCDPRGSAGALTKAIRASVARERRSISSRDLRTTARTTQTGVVEDHADRHHEHDNGHNAEGE